MTKITIEKRDTKRDLKSLRSNGFMPAVFYGKKTQSTPVSVSQNEFNKVWKEAGESSVIVLRDKEGKEMEALIHAVDLDPVLGSIRHADFYVFEKGHKVEVSVPLEFVGVSPAIKELGGILVKVMHELPIKAMPKDLPNKIEIDISVLKDFESNISAKDIELPSGVELNEKPEEVVALVNEPKEEEEVKPEEVDISSIEVEKKGKKEEGEEAASNPESAKATTGKQQPVEERNSVSKEPKVSKK